MMKSIAVSLLAMLAAALPAEANDAPGRLAYEIVVTNPGTRSQGWRGTLFAADGSPLQIEPGGRLETPAGAFVSVACRELWVPCGMIEQRTVAWLKSTPGNAVMDGQAWSYRLYVSAEGTKSEGWTGELLHADLVIEQGSADMDTPMGPYVWLDSPHPWGQHGWFHRSWTAPR